MRCLIIGCLIASAVFVFKTNGDESAVNCVCEGQSGRLPHPEECQLYYDCEHNVDQGRWFDSNMFECPYPQVYNANTKDCDFNFQQCGSRKVHKDKCDYRAQLCGTGHCRTCAFDFPSCQGLPNGNNSDPFTPVHYIECQNERLVKKALCGVGGSHVFSPSLKRCVKAENRM